MRKTAVPLAAAVFVIASVFNLQCRHCLAGVNLPDTTTVGDKSLVLNGLGLQIGVYGEGICRRPLP